MAINARSRGFLFDEVKLSTPQKSAFDLSFENKLSSNMGYLVPTLCKEVLPGDYLELRSSCIVRFAPTLAPILHKVDVMTYTFFVPNRLLWNNWEKFISPGNGNVPMAQQASFVPPVPPYFTAAHLSSAYGHNSSDSANQLRPKIQGKLADYLGIPNISADTSSGYSYTDMRFSLLPFLAYNLIWSEYFRDQNLEENPFENGTLQKNDGSLAGASATDDVLSNLFTLRKKAWEKDYFTSALPTPQRGPDVLLPLGADASLALKDSAVNMGFVETNDTLLTRSSDDQKKLTVVGVDEPVENNSPVVVNQALYVQGHPVVYAKSGGAASTGVSVTNAQGNTTIAQMPLTSEIINKVKVDLSAASSATVETLRNAFKLQEFLEKSARAGSRYIESLFGHFGVTSSDARLQRPELLGSHREPVVVSAIEQQSATSSEPSPTGTLYGKLTSTQQLDTVRYTAEEHGFIMQLQCVLPRTSYQQGVHRMYTHRETYLDYAWPEFAHLGEQEVYNSELYNGFDAPLSGESADFVSKTQAQGLFGYQPRYCEYKYNLDEVHGDFRSNLRFWHLSRIFSSLPTLSAEFIHADPRYDIFAVTDDKVDHLYQEIWHDFKMVRCLPEYGTPHF